MNTSRCFLAACAAALAAGLLGSCGGGGEGGGGVTGSVTVTPLNGVWINTVNSADKVQFLSPGPKVALFSSKTDVVVNLFQEIEPCPGTTSLEGTLDNGKLTLYAAGTQRQTACLVGTFKNMRALDAAAPNGQFARRYENDRVDVGLACGLWVSDGSSFKFKFTGPQFLNNGATIGATGNDVSAATARPFSGSMTGFTSTALPTVDGLAYDSAPTAFPLTKMVFVDGARMEGVDTAGQTVKLQRQPDPPESTCTF